MNEIICADVLDGLKQVKDNSVHLSFTSVPYNLSIKYNTYKDDIPFKKYISWLKDIFMEIYRVSVDGGRCAINIDAIKNDEPDIEREYRKPIFVHIYNLMKEIGWMFRDEICWYKQNISGNKASWGSWMSCSNPCIRRNHEYIYVFSKNNWKLDGDNELSDLTGEEFCLYTASTWEIQPDTRKLANHPAIFPEELAKRIIKLYSYRNNIVLDCFCGSGTVPYVAKLYGRNYIGIDMDKNYCNCARERVESANSLFKEKYISRSERIKKDENKEEDLDIFGEQHEI